MNEAPVSPADVGLYVHYPYCERKCPYCDFNVHAIPHDDTEYADAIIAELEARHVDFVGARGLAPELRSLYFGGGTPSEWDAREVARVIGFVRARLGLAPDAEVTLEANPGTLADGGVEALVAAGVNRFSIGGQSFLPHELEILGRLHGPEAIQATVGRVKAAGARVSLDLIYGLPGQTEDDVARSIDRALTLDVDHLSAYTLTIEPDTTLGRRAALGTFHPLDDDRQADLIEFVTDRLGARGYVRYEVSSYAPPGREAVHNTLYWMGGAYLGVGAGAHSFSFAPDLSSAVRREGLRAPAEYLRDAKAGRFSARVLEHLDQRELVADLLFVGVRTRFGLDLAALARRADLEGTLEAAVEPVLDGLVANGLLAREGTRFRPTPRGFFFTDLMGRRLLEAAKKQLPPRPLTAPSRSSL